MRGQPNILFYFSDQQRADTVNSYGQELNVTPNLDCLAREGTLFENAFTVQPVCGPARAVLQSGRYATEVGCWRNGISLPVNIPTLAGTLSNAGYETAYVGKWHLASDRDNCDLKILPTPPNRRGGYQDYWMAADVLEFTSHGYNGYVFDRDGNKHDFIGYRTDCITDFAIDYLHKKQNDTPFFLFLSHIEPHHQNDHGIFEGPYGSKREFADFHPPADLIGKPGDWQQNYPDYLGQCHSLDYNLGRMIAVLKDKGWYENTIIIYTSDHGCHFRTRVEEYKRSCHDSSIRIPMIIRGPGFNSGGRRKEFASLLDLPATILSCANVPLPDGWRGRPLNTLLNGQATQWQNEVYIQISESQTGRALRNERWTFSVRAIDGKRGSADIYQEEYLYDNVADPAQSENLAGLAEVRDVRLALRDRLIARMQEAGENAEIVLL